MAKGGQVRGKNRSGTNREREVIPASRGGRKALATWFYGECLRYSAQLTLQDGGAERHGSTKVQVAAGMTELICCEWGEGTG